MTTAPNADKAAAIEDKPPTPEGYVRLTIDGIEVLAPKGEVVIRTCERLGIEIPRFCDHPLLDPIAACRQCLVEVEMGGRKMPKPQPSCAQTVAEGLVVHTQFSSEIALRAQHANLEFLLINHPLDCPMCDKGGECPLQNQDLQHGPGESRFHEAKRVFVKPVPISSEILLDRDRCVLCYRCTRFSEQIAGDPFIDMLGRGVQQQVGIGPQRPFQSYFSGNTIQICPVGALTSTAYRFRSRPFDLVSSPSICEHCAAGCAIRTDHRRNVVLRRLAGNDPQVNEEWSCDKGRFAFRYAVAGDRIDTPLLRGADGVLAAASWTDAMAAAAAGLAAARDGAGVGVLTGGRLTVSDAYAYAKFARLALSTNDIDFRARAHSAEETAFLSARVVGSGPENGGVTYAALEQAPVVLLVALEPEEECPILFLRLRKAARHSTVVAAVAPLRSRGLEKMSGRWLPATPGTEVAILARLVAAGAGDPAHSASGAGGTGTGNADAVGTGTGNSDAVESSIAALLAKPGAVVLVGERAAQAPGLLTAVGALADATGAALAWVPRRAGERGALDAGALPTLLPGGRPVDDPAARAEVESAWGAAVPTEPGRDLTAMLAAVAAGGLGGLLIGGVELDDLPDPAAARAAIVAAGFVVSLEVRASAITEMADVVFPVVAPAERSGAYLDWEGRYRPFDTALPRLGGLDDGRVLDTLGVEMDVDLFTQTPRAAEADRTRLGAWSGRRAPVPSRDMPAPAHTAPAAVEPPLAQDQVRLALSRMLLDGSRGEDGEPHLAGTARRPMVRISRSRAAALGVDPGDEVTVSGPAGSVTLPVAITEMVDDAVWLPGRTARRATGPQLGADVGDPVRITATVADTSAPVPAASPATGQSASVPSSSSGGM